MALVVLLVHLDEQVAMVLLVWMVLYELAANMAVVRVELVGLQVQVKRELTVP
jgi:hypothetical protein